MSNVLARKRNVSELEFWKNGCEIRAELTRILMSDRIPKRCLYIFVIPGIALARKLMEEITAANTIYPTSEAEVEKRREHQTAAIIKCEQIVQHLQWLVDTIPEVKVASLEIVVDRVNTEVRLLKGWRKENKVLTHKKGFA